LRDYSCFRFFLFLDGDGQHDPAEIPKFLAKATAAQTSSSETGSGMLRILVDPTPVLYGMANFYRLMLPTFTLTKEL
jgi:hypothetical protein